MIITFSMLLAELKATYILKPVNILKTSKEQIGDTNSGCVIYPNSPSDAAAVFIDFSGNIKAYNATGSHKITLSTSNSMYLSSAADDILPTSTMYSPYQNGISATGYSSSNGGSLFA